MRGGLDLVEVAFCEECETIMPADAVFTHFEKTGHTTFNSKMVSRNEYNVRIGRLKQDG